MGKKVSLLTTFYEAESGYSLITVAETQIKMLLAHHYDPVVLVQENFEPPKADSVWRPETIDLRAVLPKFDLTPGIAPDFEARVELVYAALNQHLRDINVCITHDIILQAFYKEHNVAMRRYAKERPDLVWLHWIHSCPTPAPVPAYPENSRYTPPPGYVIYPNDSDKAIVCQAYGLGGQEYRVKVSRAGHAIDPLEVWPYDKLTKDLVKASDFLGGEITMVYPARLDRGKQPEKIIRLAAGIQRAGYETRVLFCDWQSAGAHFQDYIKELSHLAISLGLGDRVRFTSRLDDRCSQGIPRRVVIELMDLSTVYVHPSRVETYSLVVHEAALRGKLLVLNYDFPPMRELFGQAGLYFDFGSDRAERTYRPDEQAFWDDEAKRLIAEYRNNRVLVAQTRARREWTPAALWRELEALIYSEPVG